MASKRAIVGWFVSVGLHLVVLVGGLGCVFERPVRAVSMELDCPQGQWRLEGVQSAALDLGDWEIRIVASKVATASQIPILEELSLEIANTSAASPLAIEAGAVRLTGLARRLPLGPDGRVVLGCGEVCRIDYRPGLRAPVLPHPFHLHVTVNRPGEPAHPQRIRLVLY